MLKNKIKIFLTGGGGMVGKNILDHSKLKNYEFISPSSKELNLCDKSTLKAILYTYSPDMIIHVAGKVSGIQANIENPYEFLYDNAMMGLNVIDTAKELGIKKLINLGSSCMYPKDGINPLKEEIILKGELEPTNEGYAIAKAMTARLCQYANKKGFQYKTLIPCNLYGKYDKFDSKVSHMVPAVIKKIHTAKLLGADKLEIWGNGTARREFMYAEDLADFIYFSIENFDKIPELMNVGYEQDYSINEYYSIISKTVVGKELEFVHNLSKPSGMKQKKVDITKQQELGWMPKTSLEEGIKKTYEWFLENNKNE